MQSVLSPLVGRLSDVLDRKYLASLPPLIACVGAIICAKATSMNMLIGGGILIGITLATIAIVQSIPSEILPMKYRALANGFAFVGGAVGGLYVFPASIKQKILTRRLQCRRACRGCRSQCQFRRLAQYLLDSSCVARLHVLRPSGFLLAKEALGLPQDDLQGDHLGLRSYREFLVRGFCNTDTSRAQLGWRSLQMVQPSCGSAVECRACSTRCVLFVR